jgi:thiamine pyrophosphate-dependent acetolactate synthase large subunit-like protein
LSTTREARDPIGAAQPGGRSPATVADAIGRRLAALGADTVFGVIGSGNLIVTESMKTGGARFFASRHETGAVCMADGWARVTGRVGVCSVHQGPGLTNAVTGLAEAAKARTPVLVLAGDTPGPALTSNFRIDQHDLVNAVGAIAETIYSPLTAEADAARAYRRAALERRPVVLNLPIDLQALPAAPAPDPPLRPVPSWPAPRGEDIAAIADLLQGAQRPVIIAGRGAVLARASAALTSLGARIGALLANSAMAQGIFHGDPYALRISGGFASPVAAELLPQADVVLAFGAALNHWTTRHGELIAAGARVVQIDVEPRAIGANRPVHLAVVGDAGAVAEALDAELGSRGFSATGFRTEDIRA